MNENYLTGVLELALPSFPARFKSVDLEHCASSMLRELEALLDTKNVLKHTVLGYEFKLSLDDGQRPCVLLLVSLELQSQQILDFGFGMSTLGQLEQMVLNDRSALIQACRDLPTQMARASVAFADRISSACLNLPTEELQAAVMKNLRALLNARYRKLSGAVADYPFQHELPSFGRYEWRPDAICVRVILVREKYGYLLKFLRRDTLPRVLQHIKTLPMPKRPVELEAAAFMDRSEHARNPVDLVIRVGSKPGYEELIVADFISFKPIAHPDVLSNPRHHSQLTYRHEGHRIVVEKQPGVAWMEIATTAL